MLGKINTVFTNNREDLWIFGVIVVTGLASLLASVVLSVESITLAADSSADLSCNLNAVVNCGSVMQSESSYLFGVIPNSFIGMITEPVVVTVAVAGLAGVRFPRWFMGMAQLGFTLGFVFAYWMLYQSMFVIGALCPWCLSVTLSTTIMVAALTRYNLRENNLYLPGDVHKKSLWWINKKYDIFITAIIIFLVVVGILLKYGNSLFA